MSIRITSTAEWFRCISPAATLEERRAALAKLIRMLVGDTIGIARLIEGRTQDVNLVALSGAILITLGVIADRFA
jgi:hypothetical protein